MAISGTGAHFPQEIMLMGVRWYVAYPLSTCHVEARMDERGVEVKHSTLTWWVSKSRPQLEEAFYRRTRPVWISWWLDETSSQVKGEWKCLYRAVDKQGQTIDFLRTEHRDTEAARRFLTQAIRRNGLPETITIQTGATAPLRSLKQNLRHNLLCPRPYSGLLPSLIPITPLIRCCANVADSVAYTGGNKDFCTSLRAHRLSEKRQLEIPCEQQDQLVYIMHKVCPDLPGRVSPQCKIIPSLGPCMFDLYRIHAHLRKRL
jgi:transposase-like protein